MPEASVINYARRLKEAGLMTTGARGKNAPEMTPMDAARLTLAIATTDSPLQCVERVQRFGQIKFSPTFKKSYLGYETITPDHFSTLFEGETLEEVLAYMFGLPAKAGIEKSCAWFNKNIFHLRVNDFEVLAELYRWKTENGIIIGEMVVPFQGDRWDKDFAAIRGGVRTERTITAPNFLNIGLGLMHIGLDEAEAD